MASRYLTALCCIFVSLYFSHCHEAQNPLTGDQGVPAHEHHIRRDNAAPDQHGAHPGIHDASEVKFDGKVMHDKAHIHSHMDGLVKPDENASDDELEFYYFKLHDYNKDDHLDGLELLKAFLHEHKDESGQENHHAPDLTQIISTIDQILHSHDKDNDGRLNYMEYHKISSD